MKMSTALKIGEGVCFAFSGLALYYAVPILIQLFASTSPNFLRMSPFFLMTATLVLLTFLLHALLHSATPRSRKATLFGGGTLLLLLGAANVVFLMVLAFDGTFASLWQSRFNWLYPVDALLVGLFADLFGAGTIYWGWKKEASHPYAFLPPKALWKRIAFDYLLTPIYAMVAMFFAANLLMLPWTIDRDFSNFGITLAFYLLMLLPLLEIGLYEYWGREIQEEGKQFQFHLRYAPSFLLLGLACSLWGYFGALNVPRALTESLTAAFPLDFMASSTYGPLLLYLINLIPPLLYVLNFLFAKKSEAKKREEALPAGEE